MAAAAMIGSWAPRLAEWREARTATAATASTAPTPIRIASTRSTSDGRWASQIRYATPMITAPAATPLRTGRLHGRAGRGTPTAAHAAPNKGSAVGARDTLRSLANSKNDNGQDRIFSCGPPPPHSWAGGAQRRRGWSLLPAFGLRSLGHGSLQRRPAAGVQRVHLLLAILAVASARGGM